MFIKPSDFFQKNKKAIIVLAIALILSLLVILTLHFKKNDNISKTNNNITRQVYNKSTYNDYNNFNHYNNSNLYCQDSTSNELIGELTNLINEGNVFVNIKDINQIPSPLSKNLFNKSSEDSQNIIKKVSVLPSCDCVNLQDPNKYNVIVNPSSSLSDGDIVIIESIYLDRTTNNYSSSGKFITHSFSSDESYVRYGISNYGFDVFIVNIKIDNSKKYFSFRPLKIFTYPLFNDPYLFTDQINTSAYLSNSKSAYEIISTPTDNSIVVLRRNLVSNGLLQCSTNSDGITSLTQGDDPQNANIWWRLHKYSVPLDVNKCPQQDLELIKLRNCCNENCNIYPFNNIDNCVNVCINDSKFNNGKCRKPAEKKDIYGSWVKKDSVESITINKDNSLLYTNNNPTYHLNYSYNGKYDPINKYICLNDYMCERFDDPNEQNFFKLDPNDNNSAIRSDNYGNLYIFTRV